MSNMSSFLLILAIQNEKGITCHKHYIFQSSRVYFYALNLKNEINSHLPFELSYYQISIKTNIYIYDDISYLIALVHFFRILDMDEEDAQIKLLKKISETTCRWDDFLPTFEPKSNIVLKLNGPQIVNNRGH